MRIKKYVGLALAVILVIMACIFSVRKKDVEVGKGDGKSVEVSTIEDLAKVLENIEVNAERLSVKDENVTVSLSYQDNTIVEEKVEAYLTADRQYYTFKEVGGGTVSMPNRTYSYCLSVQKELYIEGEQAWGRITEYRYTVDRDFDSTNINMLEQEALEKRTEEIMKIQKLVGQWKPVEELYDLGVEFISTSIITLGRVMDTVATTEYKENASGYFWKEDINAEDYNDKPLNAIVVNVSKADQPCFGVYSANNSSSNNEVANFKLEVGFSNIGNTKVERPSELMA